MQIRNIKTETILLSTVIVIAVLSQIKDIVILGQLNTFFWIVLAILSTGRRISASTKEYIFWFTLLVLYLSFMYITDYYLKFPHTLRLIFTPLLVIIVADSFGKNGKDDIELYTCVYLISTVVLAIYLNQTSRNNLNEWIESETYLIVQKNSASQICASAIIASFCFIRNDGNLKKIAKYAGISYLFFSILLLQSRTCFFALIASALYFISKTQKNKKKLFIAILLLIGLIVLLMNDDFNKFVSHALLIDKYENRSFDDYSSGRTHAVEDSLQLFCDHPAFGLGYYYVDCFYVNILVNIGLAGGIIVFMLLGRRFYQCFLYKGKENEEMFLKCISIFYICEATGEAVPPFGPGAACFMFWFISTILLKKESVKDISLQDKNIA